MKVDLQSEFQASSLFPRQDNLPCSNRLDQSGEAFATKGRKAARDEGSGFPAEVGGETLLNLA
jgi:hypothetical protein